MCNGVIALADHITGAVGVVVPAVVAATVPLDEVPRVFSASLSSCVEFHYCKLVSMHEGR